MSLSIRNITSSSEPWRSRGEHISERIDSGQPNWLWQWRANENGSTQQQLPTFWVYTT